jgi:putative effector of murein hydrolase LrgA (UPF0299 family)
VLLNQAALLAAALRLRATLAAFRVRLSPAQAMAIHLRSLFYFFFVPLSVGLEVSRYLDIRRIDPAVPAKTLVLVLLLDRVLGLVAAVAALAMLAYVVLPASFWAALDARWLAGGGAAVLVVGGLVLLRRPWRERAVELLRALRVGSVRLLLPVLLSLLALALVCASVYVVAVASGWAAGFAQVSFALSASLLGMALPVSLFGAPWASPPGLASWRCLGCPRRSRSSWFHWPMSGVYWGPCRARRWNCMAASADCAGHRQRLAMGRSDERQDARAHDCRLRRAVGALSGQHRATTAPSSCSRTSSRRC